VGRIDDPELAQISRRIREFRAEAGLTLQELARRSGVATSTIQKVETEQMIPSVAVVMKIARGLGRRTAELVHEGEGELEVVHLRARDRHPIGARESVLVERLSGDLSDPALETWRVTLQPGAGSGRLAIAYEGEEIVLCETGRVSFRVGDRDHDLRPGDSLHFKASIPHYWTNEGSAPAVFTVTGTLPPKFRAAMRGRWGEGPRGAVRAPRGRGSRAASPRGRR